MDRSRSLKRPSDGEPSASSQRQRVEGSSSQLERLRRMHGFPPMETTVAPSQSQEIHERHESTSEVPAWQQVGREDLLRLRSQIQQTNQFLQETHHRSQAVLEGLDQHIAQMQQQAGSSEVSASGSHYGYHQQDTRPFEISFYPPTRNEQQEEIFSLDGYPVDCPSDSDHESDRRDPLEAHGAARSTPARSSQITTHREVLLQVYASSPQNSRDYLNLISLDQRPDLSMEQRDIAEGRKPFKSYLQKYEYEAFKSGRRLKDKKISETKFPLRERLAYIMYNKFRSIQKYTKYHYTDEQVENQIYEIRCTKEYKEAFSGFHERIIASLGNEGSSLQQQREVVVLSDSKEDREKSPKQKQPSASQSREGENQRPDQAQEGASSSKIPRFDSATSQDQLYEQQQSKGKELDNTDQLKDTEKQFGLYPSWSYHLNDVTWDNMGYQLDMGFREVLARQQEAGPSRQGDAPNKISPSDLNTHPDESHEQQQHDKGKSTMIPELKEYLMRSLAANPAPQTYIDNLSKYLSSLSKEDQIEYLRRSRAVDPAVDYFSRLSGKDKKAFHDFYEYINKAMKEAKMDRNVAIDVGKKWFPKGYQHYKQWQEKMRRSENTSGS